MPYYEVLHATPLTHAQRSSLAEKITYLHTTLFTTPSLFVNVKFTDISSGGDYFVAGKPRRCNHVLATVRAGGGRSREHWKKLCNGIERCWEEVVGAEGQGGENGEGEQWEQVGANGEWLPDLSARPKVNDTNGIDRSGSHQRSLPKNLQLRAVFVLGSIAAGTECSLFLPEAGGDRQWLKENLDLFEQKAKEEMKISLM